jgi:aryl-alcohol dehydrogenase-like predicted oxidoreductase
LKPSGQEFETLEKKGLSLGKLTIKYLLQSDVIATVLPAMNSVEEVLENVQASGDGLLTEDEERFLQIYREEGDKSFAEILPENDYWITPWK